MAVRFVIVWVDVALTVVAPVGESQESLVCHSMRYLAPVTVLVAQSTLMEVPFFSAESLTSATLPTASSSTMVRDDVAAWETQGSPVTAVKVTILFSLSEGQSAEPHLLLFTASRVVEAAVAPTAMDRLLAPRV